MKKFRFKFEAVETVRKTKENEALRILAEAQRAYQAARNHRIQLQTELDQALLNREQLGIDPTTATAFYLAEGHITGSKQRIIQSEQAIQRASRGVEKTLRAYLIARRQTRTMEMLREREFAEYKKERAKFEQRQQDDLYVMRAAMNAANREEAS